jgi:hypothetical protein
MGSSSSGANAASFLFVAIAQSFRAGKSGEVESQTVCDGAECGTETRRGVSSAIYPQAAAISVVSWSRDLVGD